MSDRRVMNEWMMSRTQRNQRSESGPGHDLSSLHFLPTTQFLRNLPPARSGSSRDDTYTAGCASAAKMTRMSLTRSKRKMKLVKGSWTLSPAVEDTQFLALGRAARGRVADSRTT